VILCLVCDTVAFVNTISHNRAAALLLCAGLCSYAAFAAEPAVLLRVEGAVTTPLTLTVDDLAKMPRSTASRTEEGETVNYEGVLLYDVLVKAGVPFGKPMYGKSMAKYILATAKDGYQVVFALPEIDPAFVGSRVLLADKRNGGPLYPTQQPIQVIAPQDKLPARSMFSLVKIEVVALRP
jgi:hypothetical protein